MKRRPPKSARRRSTDVGSDRVEPGDQFDPPVCRTGRGVIWRRDADAKTVAELTSQQDGVVRQQVIEQLMRRIMHYDTEFRREEATSEVGSKAKH